MALSNWDTLALVFDDAEGWVASDGEVTNHNNVTLRIYKNWLYVSDEAAWLEGRGYVSPVVMQIDEGQVHYGGWVIDARRGPQGGVFVIAQSYQWNAEPRGQTDRRLLVGCGVYGFDEKAEDDQGEVLISQYVPPLYLGVTDTSRIFLLGMVNEKVDGYTRAEMGRDPAYRPFPDTQLAALADTGLKVGKRFNQGDAFFAEAFGIDTPATDVGATEGLIIEDLIKGMSND